MNSSHASIVCHARSSTPGLFSACLLQAIDGVTSLALCSQVASRPPRQFRSSEEKATCVACLICSVIPHGSSMRRKEDPHTFFKVKLEKRGELLNFVFPYMRFVITLKRLICGWVCVRAGGGERERESLMQLSSINRVLQIE